MMADDSLCIIPTNKKFFFGNDNSIIAVVAAVAGLVYSRTLAPSVVQIDSGELAAVQALGGVAHPTGYPLFTMLGHGFLKIPLGVSKIFQSNLLSLIWCVVGLIFIVKSLLILFRSIDFSMTDRPPGKIELSDKKPKNRSIQQTKSGCSSYTGIISAIGGGLFLAFSRTFWVQSSSVEVYSLQIALLGVIAFGLVKAFFTDTPSDKPWMWVAVGMALGFSNHMTTILIVPGVLYLFFVKKKFQRSTWKTAVIMIAIFLAVLSLVYMYLPLRAARNPVLNWGNPENWGNFFRHVSGKQYRVWLFSSSIVAVNNLTSFIRNFPSEFTWTGLILGLVGLFTGFGKSYRFSVALLITFVVTVLYSVNYDIHDLESYFLLAYIVFAFWIALGIRFIVEKIGKKIWRTIFVALVVIGVLFEAFQNFSKADQSDLYVFEDYTKQAMNSLPQDAMLLSYQWDYLISPAYYFQFVEDYRRDIVLIDKELLRRSWYFHQMSNNYPAAMDGVAVEVELFLTALAPFEEGGDFNPSVLEKRYRHLIARLIETNLEEREVFIAPELVEGELRRGELHLPPGLRLVPDLYFFRVVASDEYMSLSNYDVSIRFSQKDNTYSDTIRSFVSKMLAWRAIYEMQYGYVGNAREIKNILRSRFPGVQLPPPVENL